MVRYDFRRIPELGDSLRRPEGEIFLVVCRSFLSRSSVEVLAAVCFCEQSLT
jgi:hypothetical protein